MAGDEEAKYFLLRPQTLMLVPFWYLGQTVRLLRHIGRKHAEKSVLAELRVALRLLPTFHGAIETSHELRPRPQRIHGAALDQRFEHAFVQEAEVYLFAELEYRGKFLKFGASLN